MQVISNSVDPTQVREEQRDGDRYLVVEDVPFLRAMNLAGGYVPEDEIRSNVSRWGGVPITANHPRNVPGKSWYDADKPDNAPIPVTTSEAVRREYVVGNAENPWHDGTWTRVDIAINADVAEAMGGHAADIVDKVEGEHAVDVSSQYLPKQLPPGQYDGDQRANVEGIEHPDSIAVLPHKPGQCSREDGCGINPTVAANSADIRVPAADGPEGGDGDTSANAADYTATDVGPGDIDEWTDDEWDGSAAIADLPNPSEDDDAPGVLDATHAAIPQGEDARTNKANWKLPFRTGPDAPANTRALVAIDAALSGGRGGVEGLGDTRQDIAEWVESMLAEAPDDLFGSLADGEMSANTLEGLGRRIASALGLTGAQHGNEGAESSAERDSDPASESGSTMQNRDTLIDEITSNSEIESDSLEGMGDQCLQATHKHIVANGDGNGDPDDPEEDETEEQTGGPTLAEMTLDELADGLESRGFVTEGDVGEAVANAQQRSEKEQRVDRIVANSTEYEEDDRDDLLDTPDSVLSDIESGLSANGTLPGVTGAADRATANAAGGEDIGDYPDGTIGGDL